jgi:hypothetical protein
MASRTRLALQLVDWVGRDRLTVIDARRGWPSYIDCATSAGVARLAAHLGPIGLSQRGRDAVERRFQNPDKDRPVVAPRGTTPMLLGLAVHRGKRLLVGMDAYKRVGKKTRQSLFLPIQLLRDAAQANWAEHYNDAGEKLIAFAPSLLPLFVEVYRKQVEIPPAQIQSALDVAGESAAASPAGLARAMVIVSKLARDAAFSRNIRKAYGGSCAMCGLSLCWVEGAHIYPVSAPGSTDTVPNGIALCRNHHAAFDAFYIHIAPRSGKLRLHPRLLEDAQRNSACRIFVSSTYGVLKRPARRSQWPADDLLIERYKHFASKYAWTKIS